MADTDVTMPDADQKPVATSLGIDYGTSSDKIAFQLALHGVFDKTVKLLVFDGGETELPASVAWYDGEFFCGFELQRMIRNEEIPVQNVIQCLKMAIHEEAEDVPLEHRSSQSKHTLAQLNVSGKTLQETLNAHMIAIIAIAEIALRKSPYFRLLEIDTETVEIEFSARLSVPQQWTIAGRKMMSDAAAAAGIENIPLASEPQCSLAALLDAASKVEFGLELCKLKQGSKIIVNDLGCGTSDVVLYELMDDMGIHSRLEAKTKSAGNQYGSQEINEIVYQVILDEIKKAGKTLEDICGRMGITLSDFRWHALAGIEETKMQYPGKKLYSVSIPRSNGTLKHFDFDQSVMEGAQNAVIQEILALNQHVLAREGLPDVKPDAVVTVGGHASSKSLRQAFLDYYNPKGIDVFGPHDFSKANCLTLVATGALSDRYPQIAAQTLPTNKYAFAFLLDQKYNRADHTDCQKIMTRYGKEHRTMDYDKVIKTVRTESNSVSETRIYYAPDRIVNVIRKGETEVLEEEGWRQQYDVPSDDDPVIHARFVYMTGNLKSGAPARDNSVEKIGELRQGVFALAKVTARVSKELLKQKDVPLCEISGVKGLYFSFEATMKVKYEGEKEITVGWEIHTPKGIIFVAGGQSVWDGKRSLLVGDQDHVDTTQQ
ncbi:unnamed protein product [Zymoseptoria tritici ST99CH_1A5]|uniref:Uncharacterized protein n=1 Tax=Zymoseptoria tritici ST99CH_1A5 TaxID=1276529 RepID=A0A1Y6LYD4_ZYMTR|nr:unnamed protein product [Zymoseptoria tritici ST99CH_1A5]